MKKNILFVVAYNDFRDEEFFIPFDILTKDGFDIFVASNQAGTALGSLGGDIKVDFPMEEVDSKRFDSIVFAGGGGCLKNLNNEKSWSLLLDFFSNKKLIAAICIAPVILAEAGILKSKKATVWSSNMDKSPIKSIEKMGAFFVDNDLVVDGNIITANGPDAADKFGQAISWMMKNH